MTRFFHALRARMTARRVLGTFLVALHLGGLTTPWAEARLEAGIEFVVHIEGQADGPCAPAHDHAACLFCQHLGTELEAATGAPGLVTAVAALPPAVPIESAASCATPLDPNPVRGPPLA